MKPIIIIGAGMAGYSVARELRKLDKRTPLIIITADEGDAYAKPMLSNAFAQGKQAEQLVSQTAPQMAAQLQALIHPWSRVTEIDPQRKVIRSDAGPFNYEKLVIAAGAQPIRLPIDGDGADRVLSVNHLSDYAAFRARLMQIQGRPAHVAILGAGLIGCEFANDLAHAGHAVTLIDPNPLPLSALAAPALSQGLQAALEAGGVRMCLGTRATRIDRDADSLHLMLADGSSLNADLVLSAVGLRPDLQLAHAAGLRTARGILVDAYGRTSDQHIYALGDCAEYAMPGDGGTRVLPYIAPLMSAARAIARSLSGQPAAIDWKPAPVIVKTPCYPLALMPPEPHRQATGGWQVSSEGQRTVCRFIDERGILHGFGIAPQEAALRQQLTAALGSVIASDAIDLAA